MKSNLLRYFVPVGLGCLFLVSTGCDQIAKSIDEKHEERSEAQELFAKLDARCPVKINEYTTLKNVTYALGEAVFVYEVSESGRDKVILTNMTLVQAQVLDRLKGSPAEKVIDELNLVTKHIYNDLDGKRMLGFEVTPQLVRSFKGLQENDILIRTAGLSTDKTQSDLAAALAEIKNKPSMARAKAWFESVNRECPKKIDEHTTLQWVRFTGKKRVEYRYEMLKAGYPDPNQHVYYAPRNVTAREMRESRLGDAIMALDLSVKHSYKCPQNTQVLAYVISRNELIRAGKMQEPSTTGLADDYAVLPGTDSAQAPETSAPTTSALTSETPNQPSAKPLDETSQQVTPPDASTPETSETPGQSGPPNPKTNPFFN